jgi:hypothetical protein
MTSSTDASKASTEKTAGETPKSSSGKRSVINLILLYSTLVGLGAIGGYAIFYSLFSHRCSDMMDDAERRHNETRQELQNRYIVAMEDHHACLDDEATEAELLELRDRTKGQADLVGKHQSLLEKHQENVELLAKTQSMQEQTKQQVSQLLADVERKQRELADMKKMLDVVTTQNDRKLKDRTGEDAEAAMKKTDECRAAQASTKAHVQQLHDFLTKQKYVLLARICYVSNMLCLETRNWMLTTRF